MFDLTENINNSSDEEDSLYTPSASKNDSVDIASCYSTEEAIQKSIEQAAKTYAKPDTYTGNRAAYDDAAAKKAAKEKLFQQGDTVKDPYTGKVLYPTEQEAKRRYGKDWSKGSAESDHVISLKTIYEETKDNVWNTVGDVKTAANSEDNIKVTSRQFNNAKRSRSNEDLVKAPEYLDVKGIKLTDVGKKQALKDAKTAKQSINIQLNCAAAKNMVKTGHEAGMAGAMDAGITALTMSGIINIVAVIKGEKDSSEAIADTVKESGAAALTGYVMSDGLTIVSHSLSNSSSEFIQGLINSNVPAKVITAVIATGDTLKKFAEGDITTQECLIELGDKALNMATIGYSMAVGQAMIPIPGVGAAVGALVGSVLTSELYSNCINYINRLKNKELEHQRRMQIIRQCNLAAQQTKAFRCELEIYLDSYLKDYKECFDYSLSAMELSCRMGDVDGIIASANDVIRQLGGEISYRNKKEFLESWNKVDKF